MATAHFTIGPDSDKHSFFRIKLTPELHYILELVQGDQNPHEIDLNQLPDMEAVVAIEFTNRNAVHALVHALTDSLWNSEEDVVQMKTEALEQKI